MLGFVAFAIGAAFFGYFLYAAWQDEQAERRELDRAANRIWVKF